MQAMTKVLQKFTYTWPEGKEKIEFRDWLRTLSQEEQDEYWAGRRNGDRLRQIAIDEGRLEVIADGYLWRDEEAKKIHKENDPVWLKYWLRWQDETGVVFSSEYIEVHPNLENELCQTRSIT
jgi:hypothetical protein